ncbi:hypothetical protein PTTG_30830, partial [Puccinia triticina 1-1 BBBD Race 1]
VVARKEDPYGGEEPWPLDNHPPLDLTNHRLQEVAHVELGPQEAPGKAESTDGRSTTLQDAGPRPNGLLPAADVADQDSSGGEAPGAPAAAIAPRPPSAWLVARARRHHGAGPPRPPARPQSVRPRPIRPAPRRAHRTKYYMNGVRAEENDPRRRLGVPPTRGLTLEGFLAQCRI